MLRFENYCAQPVEMGADGLPVHNAHGGYDLQGVRAAAQRHDGTMTLHWADGWFTLRILLPVQLPQGEAVRNIVSLSSHSDDRRFVILHNKTVLEIVD